MRRELLGYWGIGPVAVLLAAFGLLWAGATTPGTVVAQEYEQEEYVDADDGTYGDEGQDYEYEPDEGLHEEEWYDPSDWFDNDQGIDYEGDTEDYGQDEGMYDEYGETGYGDYDYGYGGDYYTEDWYEDEAFSDWYEW